MMFIKNIKIIKKFEMYKEFDYNKLGIIKFVDKNDPLQVLGYFPNGEGEDGKLSTEQLKIIEDNNLNITTIKIPRDVRGPKGEDGKLFIGPPGKDGNPAPACTNGRDAPACIPCKQGPPGNPAPSCGPAEPGQPGSPAKQYSYVNLDLEVIQHPLVYPPQHQERQVVRDMVIQQKIAIVNACHVIQFNVQILLI